MEVAHAPNDQVTASALLRRLEARGTAVTLQGLADGLPPSFPAPPDDPADLDALERRGSPSSRTRWRVAASLEADGGLPPGPRLAFSPTELMALTFSRGLLRPLEGTQLQAALDSALTKAAAALPPAAHGYLQQLDGLFASPRPHVSYRSNRETMTR